MASKRRSPRLYEEACGLMLGGLGLFILLALCSWSPTAPTAAVGVSTANWAGPVGHQLASALIHVLGVGAVLVVGLLGYGVPLWFSGVRRAHLWALGLGGTLLLLGASLMLQLGLTLPPTLMADAGGMVGRGLTGVLMPYCHLGGSLLIGALVAALGVLTLCRPWWSARRGALRRLRWRGLLGPLTKPGSPRPRATGRRQRRRVPPFPSYSSLRSVLGLTSDASPGRHDAAGETSAIAAAPGPPLSLFDLPRPTKPPGGGSRPAQQSRLLLGTLRAFGVDGRVLQVLPGPVVTTYEFEPASGIKLSRIVNLADDLALGMKALSVRIVAPIPGKSVVGIEVPNPLRQAVYLRQIVASAAFQQPASALLIALGKDIVGRPIVTDLAQIPHLLIAGATGSGKSVGLNSMICSLLLNATPEDVRFIMIDPKMLELSVYDGIPHLVSPVVTHPHKAAAALRWAVGEMERRYRVLAEHGVRNLETYNRSHPQTRLPYLVVVIDELADLMLVARRDVEDALTRLAQMARASGIHLVVATQRPSVDVLTGIIKANFPARISFQVASRTDSRTILDAIGAERLLGKGDMLFLPPGTSKLVRIHGAYVSEAEVKRLVDYLRKQYPAPEARDLGSAQAEGNPDPLAVDDQYAAAVALVARHGRASAALIQHHLQVGSERARDLLEALARQGVTSPTRGKRRRQESLEDLPTPSV